MQQSTAQPQVKKTRRLKTVKKAIAPIVKGMLVTGSYGCGVPIELDKDEIERFAAVYEQDTNVLSFYIQMGKEKERCTQSVSARVKALYPDAHFKKIPVDVTEITRLYSELSKEKVETRELQEAQKLSKKIIEEAVAENASDIHIVVEKGKTLIKLRIDGALFPLKGISLTESEGFALVQSTYNTVSDGGGDSHFIAGKKQDARITNTKGKLPPQLSGCRVATSPTGAGNKLVMRLLYDDPGTLNKLEDLGYTQYQIRQQRYLHSQTKGIIIMVGPTGSGKSKTQQVSLLDIYKNNNGQKEIFTIEDPIEYSMPGITQTELGSARNDEEKQTMFDEALANLLRMDPDIAMNGEIRDLKTANFSMRLAMTGHLALTTLHANSAFGAIVRLLNMNVERDVLCTPGVLLGLVSQRLVRTLCANCKIQIHDAVESMEYDKGIYERVFKIMEPDQTNNVFVRSTKGCKKCKGRGGKGRTAVSEVVVWDEVMSEHVMKNDINAAEMHWKSEQAGMTMGMHAIEKIKQGLVDPRDVEKELGSLMIDGETKSKGVSAKHIMEMTGGVN